VDNRVRAITDALGLDPLYLANEGKFLTIISKEEAHDALQYLKNDLSAPEATIIGNVRAGRGDLYLKTGLGGTRRLDMLAGTPLPRIC
jgi:hydrogenase expression/formation protein HypE